MKKERNILKFLPDSECSAASKESFRNAEAHKRSAKAIASNGDYGIAVSHLILSTEEVTKGLLIWLQSVRFNVRNVPGVYLFFTDHIIKHRLATMISMMYPLLKLIMGFINKAREQLHNPDADIEYTKEEKAFISKDEAQLKDIFKDLPSMLDWWDEANINKNKGFYVDYTTSLQTPHQVTEEQYHIAYTVADKFEKQILEVISVFEGAAEDDKLEILKNNSNYDIKRILYPIIEARRREMKNKDPLEWINRFYEDRSD